MKIEVKRARPLKSRVFHAGGWTLAVHFATLVLRLAGTIILTRIFSPEAFGILAVVTVLQIVVTLLTDIGLTQAIVVNANGESAEFLNTAWSLQILRGLLIWVVGVMLALILYIATRHVSWPNSSVYANPELPVYMAAASFSAALLGFQSMRIVLASRNLQVKQVFVIEIAAQAISLSFVIVVGWMTHSLWSYIASLLLNSAVTVLLSHVVLVGPPDRLGWNKSALREILNFGRWTFLSSALSALALNSDRLLLGAWVSPQILGYYSIAYNLASVVENLAGRIFASVFFPALSEAVRRDPTRVSEIYFRIRWVTDSSTLFVAGLLFAVGAQIINLMYDSRYGPAGWMLQYLSLGLLFTRYGLTQNAYLAIGRPAYVTILTVTKVVSLFLLTPLLFHFYGLQGALLGIAFHMFPVAICTFILSQKRKLNNVRLELLVLIFWVIGWQFGLVLLKLGNFCCSLRVL